MKRTPIILALIISFLGASLTPAAYGSSSVMPEFLYEIGIRFYREGRYSEALTEFKKALILKPDYLPALNYVRIIEKGEFPIRGFLPEKESVTEEGFGPRAGAIAEILDLIEIERLEKEVNFTPQIYQGQFPEGAPLAEEEILPKAATFKILKLDENFSQIPQPIEIEEGKTITVAGSSIKRFLVTSPDIISVEQINPDELLVTGKDIGYAHLHVWDNSGRQTIEWLGVFSKPSGPTYEEFMRREEQRAANFKLRYNVNWSSYETGRRIGELDRSGSYTWTHTLGLAGETPYGILDSAVTVRRLNTTTDLTYASVGLREGNIGFFKDFSLRGGDFEPYFSNLSFPSTSVRGGMIISPLLNKKIETTVFWGRESGGRFPQLFPSLYKSMHSFLEGFNLDYSPSQKQDYKFSVLHGWGRDRQDYLNDYGYDLSSSWNFNDWGLGYELAYDSKTFAHLLNFKRNAKKMTLSAELRDIDKNFLSITGNGWRQGELGALFNLNYKPTDKLSLSQRLDVYQDRLYPAQDNKDRLNENLDWSADYRIDPATNLRLGYLLQNNLGRLSQSRYQSPSINLSRQFKFIRDASVYAGYANQENKNFSSPSLDYINDRLNFGTRFSLVGDLYYYVNKEFNWLEERYTGTTSVPHVFETGLDWASRLGKSPWQGNFRLTFRDEEDTGSSLSFLSGEDYIEGYTELTYHSDKETEIYGSCRLRNSWADNPNVTKRIEASFNAGMRYLWDTGLRWEAVGDIEGYVFKDLNSDGIRQNNEPPVEGIKLWLGKNKAQITDLFGHYKFRGVRGRRAYAMLDTSTLPSGFVLTVPPMQEARITHHRSMHLDFGINSRSEISGFVFEDTDQNGEYGTSDKGLEKVIIVLEDGTEVSTNPQGRYSFSNVATGEHTLTLKLESLPINYLPNIAITKKITLYEGMTFIHNIPLKRIKK